MFASRHARPADSPKVAGSAERRHLAALAGALSSYRVWARVIEDEAPFLRVSNPASVYATEDIRCERRAHNHVFLASFGVGLGTTDDIPGAAARVARLVGAG